MSIFPKNEKHKEFFKWMQENKLAIKFETNLSVKEYGLYDGGLIATIVWDIDDQCKPVLFGKDDVLVNMHGFSWYIGMSPENAVNNLFDKILAGGCNRAVYYDKNVRIHEMVPPGKDCKYLYEIKTAFYKDPVQVIAVNITEARLKIPNRDDSQHRILSIINLGPVQQLK